MLFVELHHMSRKPIHTKFIAPNSKIFQDLLSAATSLNSCVNFPTNDLCDLRNRCIVPSHPCLSRQLYSTQRAGTSGDHLLQPPASRVIQSTLRRMAPRQVLDVSTEGDPTSSAGSLCQCPATLTVKRCPLLFR